jgi:hypothetical protein
MKKSINQESKFVIIFENTIQKSKEDDGSYPDTAFIYTINLNGRAVFSGK